MVVWRAFELRPEPVPTLDPRGEYLRRAWEGSVYPLSRKLGISMKLPPVQPRTRLTHEAAHWARSLQRFDEYQEALFEAFFQRGEDIGKPDVLVSLAEGLGLEGKSLRRALESHDFAGSVLADERLAEELGVRAVPAFIADRKGGLSGVETVEGLKEIVDRVRFGSR
jgi:predicted DsbA family dithiol-disulfide isomerase